MATEAKKTSSTTKATETTSGPAALSAEDKAKRAVDAFIAKHLRNSDFSRDTPAWNHFQAGLPVLIGCIAAEMEG